MFQHTAARRRLRTDFLLSGYIDMFQHTAARRRLSNGIMLLCQTGQVSTHSRPKAAEPVSCYNALE